MLKLMPFCSHCIQTQETIGFARTSSFERFLMIKIRSFVCSLIVCYPTVVYGNTCDNLAVSFRNVQPSVDGIRVDVREIDKSAVTVQRGTYDLGQVFKNPALEVTLHITRNHYYLMVGGRKVDAEPFTKIRLRDRKKNVVGSGLFIRFVGLSLETRMELANALPKLSGERVLSCAQAVCKVLQKGAEIFVSDRQGHILTAPLFVDILNGGFKNRLGEDVPIEVYRIEGDSSLQKLHNDLQANDRHEVAAYRSIGSFFIVIGSAAVGFLSLIF